VERAHLATAWRRWLIEFAVFGPPLVLVVSALTGRNAVGQAGRVASSIALALVSPGILRVLRDPARAPLAVATALLFLAMLPQPLTVLSAGHFDLAARGVREVLYGAIWCGSFWLAYVGARSPARMRLVVQRVDTLGTLIAALVYAALAATAMGARFGEIIDSPGEVRTFGPLGDATPYLLLFFIFREIIRRRWLRLSLFVAPFLVGVPRGATLAFAVGFGYLIATDVLRALRRASSRQLVRTLTVAAVVAIAFAGSLRFTDAGDKLVRRFASALAAGGAAALGDRLPSMRRAWGVFDAHPWIGIGPAGYQRHVSDLGLAIEPAESRRRLDPSRAGRPLELEIASAQNQGLQIAAESGAVGLLFYAAFCLVALRTVRRACRGGDRDATEFFRAIDVFVVAVLFGVQTTVWILDKASLGFLTFLLLGLALRQTVLVADRVARLRVGLLPDATAGG